MKEILMKNLERIGEYHDHKEKMAWIAGSIYFAFSLIISNWIVKADFKAYKKNIDINSINILLTITLVLIFVCVLFFISMQFKMRWDAADFSTAIRRTLFKLELGEISLSIDNFENDEDQYPKEIYDEKKELEKNKRNFKEIMKSLLSIILIFGLFINIDNRYKTEITTYIVTLIFLLLQIFSVWLK